MLHYMLYNMKRIYLFIFVMVMSVTMIQAEQYVENISCQTWIDWGLAPAHYCDCSEDSKTFSFPLDLQLAKTVWYNAKLKDVKKGITAYLYADCEVKIDLYMECISSYVAYSYTLSPNQTRDIDGKKIEEKIASTGVSLSDDTKVYLKIYPVNGKGGRVICMPYNQGYHSTCSDCLEIFPNMTVVSSHADDVFYLDPAYIPQTKGLKVHWDEPNAAPCNVKITRGTCNGELLAEADIVAADQPYYIDVNLLNNAREAGERLYIHFSHNASAVGRIVLKEYTKAPTAIMDVTSEAEAKIIMDRNGIIYILRGNERYTILGNKL